MATPEQLASLREIYAEARESGHIWPAMAACEAMVETAWLTSELGRDYRNLFGQKQSVEYPVFQTVNLPTYEIYNGHRFDIRANFVWFPSYAASFSSRMDTLIRLQNTYQEYKEALHSATPEGYISSVSKRWSTDPDRAKTVLAIYQAHKGLLQ